VENRWMTPWKSRCISGANSAQRFSEKAGYVPVDKAVHDRCVYA
jgi:hypothetical protein